MNDLFHRFAHWASDLVGAPWAFITATLTVAVWALLGSAYRFSDSWQLWINTGTTIITFLMVFLIQHTQNRDTKAIHLKLDELMRAIQGARTALVDLEALSDEELERLRRQFQRLRQRYVAEGRSLPEGIESGPEEPEQAGQERALPGGDGGVPR
ncbi:MAG: low affinity iron permease family protein [Armatimonadetes bacterium]|nr:low affinity iron permease family protein [Armatimonadota bacterium]